MVENSDQQRKKRFEGGYQPLELEKGYKPIQSNLDSSNPPQSGSGVPFKFNGKRKNVDKSEN